DRAVMRWLVLRKVSWRVSLSSRLQSQSWLETFLDSRSVVLSTKTMRFPSDAIWGSPARVRSHTSVSGESGCAIERTPVVCSVPVGTEVLVAVGPREPHGYGVILFLAKRGRTG